MLKQIILDGERSFLFLMDFAENLSSTRHFNIRCRAVNFVLVTSWVFENSVGKDLIESSMRLIKTFLIFSVEDKNKN